MSQERLTDRTLLTAEAASENLRFYVVDKNKTDEHPDGDSFQVSKEALIEILGIGSGSTDQNNIRRVKGFASASSNFLDMQTAINNLSPYTVADNELMSYQTSIVDTEDPLNTTIITINTRDVGKGTYGAGETTLTGKLWISGTRRLSSGDAEIDPSTQIINLGTHTSTTVEDEFNAAAEFTVQNKTVGLRLVNITIDTVELQYFFTGVGGDYGTGGDLTALATDFSLITGDIEPEIIIPTENQIEFKIQEATVSGTFELDINTYSDFYLTMTAATELSFKAGTLPALGFGKRFKLVLTGAFPQTWADAYMNSFGDDYDGTKLNDVLCEVAHLAAGYRGEAINQQRETA
ncbi:hypothetical protein [Bizionia sp.]|uniref:hypothetical protein n=1 Tax=Bizionia sp. TaxID=1954480 RepID=UPI003A8E00B1